MHTTNCEYPELRSSAPVGPPLRGFLGLSPPPPSHNLELSKNVIDHGFLWNVHGSTLVLEPSAHGVRLGICECVHASAASRINYIIPKGKMSHSAAVQRFPLPFLPPLVPFFSFFSAFFSAASAATFISSSFFLVKANRSGVIVLMP